MDLHQFVRHRALTGGYSEQIRVGSSAVKNHLLCGFVNTVDKEPIRFDVAFPFSFEISMQRVVFRAYLNFCVNAQVS